MAGDSSDETRTWRLDPRLTRESDASARTVSRGRYRLGVLLGQGGMATVVQAEDLSLKRTVAIKRLRPELGGDAAALARFFDEAEVIAAIDHPGVVSIHDAGVLENGEAFYAMAKVQGRTLSALMLEARTAGRHVDTALLDVFQRISETMAYAHARGIVHRDLKPENVMVDTFGAVYVVDWGIAIRTASEGAVQTVPGTLLGTPAYMAPETLSSRPAAADPRGDVFALGVMLYELLTGVRPFRGATLNDLVEHVRHHEPRQPRRVNASVSRELSAICMKALAKDPDARYRSAGELAGDIRRARASLPVTAARVRVIDHVRYWTRRHPRGAAALGTLAVVILLIATIAAYALAERRLAREAMWSSYRQNVVTQQAIERELDRVRDRLQAAPAGSERLAAEYREAELARRLELARNDEGTTLGAMLGFSGFEPDANLVAATTARFRVTLRDAEARRDWIFIRAFAASRLALLEQLGDRNPVPDEEMSYLRLSLKRADTEIAERIRAGVPPAGSGGR